MALQLRLLGGDGIEHPRDTMRDIVSHHIFDKERREIDTHDRKEKEQQVVSVLLKSRRKQDLYLMHNTMQKITCHRGKHTDDKSQDQRHLAIGDMLLLPIDYPHHHTRFLRHFIYHFSFLFSLSVLLFLQEGCPPFL